MNIKYDGEWITSDLNKSIVLNLYDQKLNIISSYEANDLINVVGDDVSIGIANINDLSNLLLYGVMRFVSVTNPKEYVDIPIRTMYKLYENPNVIKLTSQKVSIENKRIYPTDLEAFIVIDGKQITKEYFFISTLIANPSQELEKLLKISKDYGKMDMNKKFVALTSVDILNHIKDKEQ